MRIKINQVRMHARTHTPPLTHHPVKENCSLTGVQLYNNVHQGVIIKSYNHMTGSTEACQLQPASKTKNFYE
jgi:hypothetical protein